MFSSDESDSSNNEKESPTPVSPQTNDDSENQLSSKTKSHNDSSKSKNNESVPTVLNTKEQCNNYNYDDNDLGNDSSLKSSTSSSEDS